MSTAAHEEKCKGEQLDDPIYLEVGVGGGGSQGIKAKKFFALHL